MAKKILLVINPNSGDGIARRWVEDMVSAFSQSYDIVSVCFSKCAGDITRIVCEYSEGYDALVCVGGDGSLNEAISGIVSSRSDIALGYIPTGTVNDFATSHGIPKNIKLALEKIAHGEKRPCDIGFISGRYFSYVAAFGAFTEVSYLTSQKSKESFGKIAYVAEAVNRFFDIKPIKVTYTVKGEKHTGEYLYGMVSNSRTIGGIRFFGSEAEDFLCDGEFEVTLVKKPENPADFTYVLMGLVNPALDVPQIVKFKTDEIVLEFTEETPFTVDGEFGGNFSHTHIKNIKNAISVIE